MGSETERRSVLEPRKKNINQIRIQIESLHDSASARPLIVICQELGERDRAEINIHCRSKQEQNQE